MKKYLIPLILLCLALIGGLVWLYLDWEKQKKENIEMQELAELNKQEMENEYEKFALQYSEMKTQINNDSIVANFVLVKILTKDLEEETARYQKELQSKQAKLEEKYNNYQINVQNQVLTKTQMQNAETQLSQEAATLKSLQEKYATILANKQASVQKEIADSIINVTTRINDKKYHAKYVMATSTGSAIVYASKEFDITEEVVAVLNRSYEKTNGKHE